MKLILLPYPLPVTLPYPLRSSDLQELILKQVKRKPPKKSLAEFVKQSVNKDTNDTN